jgi:NAD(P)H dehydrogenase (quinone)
MKTILVTGATGHLGSAVIEQLLTKMSPNNIHVLSRKREKLVEMQAAGVRTFIGDYDDTSSLEKAMADVDTVLLISAGDEGDRMQQHRNVIDMAVKCGVKCIAYTSRSLRDRSTLVNKLMLDHFDTENYIKQSGMNYTIFRNVLYLDVIPLFVGKQVFETGIFQPAGDGKVAFALRQEMGEAMANVLLNRQCEDKTYQLTGDATYSFYEVASALSELSGKKVTYTPVEISVFKTMMLDKGLPEPMIKKIIDFNADIKNNQEAEISTDLKVNLGRTPTALKEALKILFGL